MFKEFGTIQNLHSKGRALIWKMNATVEQNRTLMLYGTQWDSKRGWSTGSVILSGHRIYRTC